MPAAERKRFLTGNKNDHDGLPDVAWHGYKLDDPLWTYPSAQFLACTLGKSIDDEEDLHIILNMSDSAVEVTLPINQGENGVMLLILDFLLRKTYSNLLIKLS